MPRLVFSIVGLMAAIGFGWWRHAMVSDLNTQMSQSSFDAVGMPGAAGEAPPGDLATLSTPAGALNYLNHIAETLAEADAQYAGALDQQRAVPGNPGIGTPGTAHTSSARGGRVLSITPDAAAPQAQGDAEGDAGPAPAHVTVIRPRR